MERVLTAIRNYFPLKNTTGWFFCFIAVAVMALAYTFFPPLCIVLVAGGVVFLVACRLELGLYALVGTAFFIGWYFIIPVNFFEEKSSFRQFFNGVLDAPVADFVGLIMIGAVIIALLFFRSRIFLERLRPLVWGIFFYGLFIAAALFSAFAVYNQDMVASVKYVLRPMLFGFVAFFLVPAMLITNKTIFYRVLAVLFGVGAIIALYGLSSLALAPVRGWLRVAPYPIFGFAPMGYNHNLLAEALVGIIPLSVIFLVKKDTRLPPTFLWGSFFAMILVAFLTLSRAAWIALVIDGALLLYWYRQPFLRKMREYKKYYPLLAGVFGLVAIYMALFLGSSVVQSSNNSREAMVDIVAYYFPQAPWLGYGPGSFIKIIGGTYDFMMEYGTALDSHGFAQKILLEGGLVGLALFGVFLAWLFVTLYRVQVETDGDKQFIARCLLITVVGVYSFQLFSTSYFVSPVWMPVGIALAGSLLIKKSD